MQVSLAPTPVRPSVGHNFKFPFCQRLWALTKRRDDIEVADMEVDKVADMMADMAADKKRLPGSRDFPLVKTPGFFGICL